MVHDTCMRLDHVSYAVSSNELVDTVQRIGQQLGGSFVDGGRHPRFGTQNFVLPIEGGTYVEVVAALDHPASDKAPFGQAVKARAADGGGWLGGSSPSTTSRSSSSVSAVRRSTGTACARTASTSRGSRSASPSSREDPSLPFFLQWTSDPAEHPSLAAPAHVSVVACARRRPRPHPAWLGGSIAAPIDGSDIQWVDADEPGLVAVHFRTANGDVVRVD